MSAIVIEHVNVADLPANWRAKLPSAGTERVTVRIEEERAPQASASDRDAAIDLLFGMWGDREDMADVEGYVRKLRAPRFNPDGSRTAG